MKGLKQWPVTGQWPAKLFLSGLDMVAGGMLWLIFLLVNLLFELFCMNQYNSASGIEWYI